MATSAQEKVNDVMKKFKNQDYELMWRRIDAAVARVNNNAHWMTHQSDQDNQSFWNFNGVELAVRDATSALHIIIKNS
jgi:hypothetical protein